MTLETLLKALEWWKKSNQWQDTERIPGPSPWLNQCKWAVLESIAEKANEIVQKPMVWKEPEPTQEENIDYIFTQLSQPLRRNSQ